MVRNNRSSKHGIIRIIIGRAVVSRIVSWKRNRFVNGRRSKIRRGRHTFEEGRNEFVQRKPDSGTDRSIGAIREDTSSINKYKARLVVDRNAVLSIAAEESSSFLTIHKCNAYRSGAFCLDILLPRIFALFRARVGRFYRDPLSIRCRKAKFCSLLRARLFFLDR